MKKIIFLIAVILCIQYRSYSQQNVDVPTTGCLQNTISTNPDLVPDSFDWRTQNFTVYLTNMAGTQGTPVTIVNPYFDQSFNPNTFNLANELVKDFAPNDGWELLYKSFGEPSPGQGTRTPFFILYNRYNGTIRVFVNLINTGESPYTAAAISLSTNKPDLTSFTNRRQTAVLNQVGGLTFSSDEIQRNSKHFVPNSYLNNGVNNNYFWLYADFFALFDPCTCGLESDWYLEAGLIGRTEINATINGVIQHTMVDANPNGNDLEETALGSFFGRVQNYLAFGSGVVDGVNGTLSSGNEGKKKGDELIKNADSLIYNFGPIIGKETSKNLARSIGKILFEIPRVNMILNLSKTLISTIKKLSGDFQNLNNPQSIESIGSTSVTEYKSTYTVSGELTIKTPYVTAPLKLPGADVPAGLGGVKPYLPIYDNILGVFNLFEQPIFEIQEYRAPGIPYEMGSECDPTDREYYFPTISELKIKNPPKLVINPASGMTLKSVEYQIIFENEDRPNDQYSNGNRFSGPMIPGPLRYHENIYTDHCQTFFPNQMFYQAIETNREKLFHSIGYDLQILSNNGSWEGASFATPSLNQDCFSDYRAFSFSRFIHPQLKVKAIFEPIVNDPNSTIKEVIFVHTFNAKIELHNDASSYYSIIGTPTLPISNPNYQAISIDLPIDESTLLFGYPSDVLYSDETISSDVYAIGDITIGNNVTVGSGNFTIKTTGNIYFDKSLNTIPANSSVNFIAGKEIFVSPEAIVSPEVVLSIDPSIIKPCETVTDIVPTGGEIAAFCNGSVYNERSAASKSILVTDVSGAEEESNNELSTIDFTMYPNPATNDVSLLFDKSIESISVVLHDVAGKLVPIELTLNGREYLFNVSNCKQGIYFVTVSSYGGSQTKQLIVQ